LAFNFLLIRFNRTALIYKRLIIFQPLNPLQLYFSRHFLWYYWDQ
jgi:hypothetical protein